MRNLLPAVSVANWGGPNDDGTRSYSGRSLVIEWLGFIVEICLGREE